MELFPSLREVRESSNTLSDESRVPIFRSVEYQVSTILEKIKNIDTFDDEEIKGIIYRQHSMLLNYDLFLASDETRVQMQDLFTNKRFLKIFLDIIGLIELTPHEKVCINKLAYDYYILPKNDEIVSSLLLQISYQINNILTIKLSAILGIERAKMLSMIANSSFKLEKNVHRINTFLIKCNLDFSVQNIVDIYCILFDSFTHPFIYSMLEAKPSGMTDNQLKIFDNISLALLAILDSMTSSDIKKVLYDYAFTLKLVRVNFTVRFSLKSAISYTRITKIIEEIEMDPIDSLRIP